MENESNNDNNLRAVAQATSSGLEFVSVRELDCQSLIWRRGGRKRFRKSNVSLTRARS